jgi:hypothetical protein
LKLLAVAALVFVGCLAVQYLGYDRILAAGLRSPEPALRRRALKRWLGFALAWQSLVIAAVLVYAFVMTHPHRPGLAWIAPALGALLGTALPYQLVAVRLARAGRE